MGMAELVVTAVLVEGRAKSEVARTYGVSRRWVITLSSGSSPRVKRVSRRDHRAVRPRGRREPGHRACGCPKLSARPLTCCFVSRRPPGMIRRWP
jgi:transposase-like protein